MAEACVITVNNSSELQGNREKELKMNTFSSDVKTRDTSSDKAEVAIVDIASYAGKKSFKVACAGDYFGARWSKGVYIDDYTSSDGIIAETPNNLPVIGAKFAVKCLYDTSGNEIQLKIWNLAEHRRYFSVNSKLYRNSDGAIVFWGAKCDSLESVLKYKNEIRTLEPNIPIILLVDNVFQPSTKWIGQGLVMNSREEMDNFCSEHGFFAWFEMLERGAGVREQCFRTSYVDARERNYHKKRTSEMTK
ncbi:ras-related protein Rab-32B-like [Dendronephthya gigantea]|uniref:ras-related protein Rab-32B-like n=1 Tax=Dendronephthya gigantea TaxID=151771 RepID=UPI00106C511C|nr:ras-related protein Rab-32B-like [Dendronephthya gigantea]